MATATGAMSKMQQQMNPAKVQATVQQFAKENAKMEMAQEMMGDTLDGALDDEDTEAETGELVSQVRGWGGGAGLATYAAGPVLVGLRMFCMCVCTVATILRIQLMQGWGLSSRKRVFVRIAAAYDGRLVRTHAALLQQLCRALLFVRLCSPAVCACLVDNIVLTAVCVCRSCWTRLVWTCQQPWAQLRSARWQRHSHQKQQQQPTKTQSCRT
jgi:hypothetical protein